MKRLWIAVLVVATVSMTLGCKTTINMKQALAKKQKIDRVDNPAKKMMLKRKLTDSSLELYNVLVKDIITSNNIDYDFCVIADIQTDKGPVEAYIYSKNIRTIASLKKGITRIDVKGDFGRFFTMLDDYYIKMELYNVKIKKVKADTKKTSPAPVKNQPSEEKEEKPSGDKK